MGKRSNFERNPRDYYPTPYEAVIPLLPYILTHGGHQKKTFIEPCAGDGRLVRHLQKNGLSCIYACDIDPQADFIQKKDVLFFDDFRFPLCDLIITNPPWERNQDGTGPLHEMIDRFRSHAPTWLLFDSDWMFTGQAKPFLRFCSRIVSVGRVSWMENGTSGMDNCCWYEFQRHETSTIFCP